GKALEDVGEVAAQESGRHARAAPERLEIRPDARIPIDADELAFALQILGEKCRVASGPESGVDDGLSRLHLEEPAHLLGENRYVVSRAGLQDARQHAPHSLPPR